MILLVRGLMLVMGLWVEERRGVVGGLRRDWSREGCSVRGVVVAVVVEGGNTAGEAREVRRARSVRVVLVCHSRAG